MMIRSKKFLVTVLLMFFSVSFLAAQDDPPETTDKTEIEQKEQQEQKVEQKEISPKIPNLDNDQWRKENIRYRIPKEFEFTQPLLTYKEQQVA